MIAKRLLAGALIFMLQIMSFAPIQAQAAVSFERVGDGNACTTHVQNFISDGSEIDVATGNAVVEAYTDSRHTAAIDNAIWVWPTAETIDAKNGESQTIEREFVIVGNPMGGSLDIAVDNVYSVYINGQLIGEDLDENATEDNYNFTAAGQDLYPVPASVLRTGVNTLRIEARNWSSSFTLPIINPAGILYGLEITSQECNSVCELTVTSDEETSAHGTSDHAVLAYGDSRWTANVEDAEWIWSSEYTLDPKNGETQEFSRTFVVEGDLIDESATLRIAADNTYEFNINGVKVGEDTDLYNFTAEGQDEWDISDYVTPGVNTIHFTVRNASSSFSNKLVNIAGFAYTISIQSEVEGGECVMENQPPVIVVIGDNPITIQQFDDFTDPGAIANDLEDGDLTPSIVFGGDAVDTDTPGTYVITYDVTDSGGLAAEQKTRTVIVEPATPHICSVEFVSEPGTTFADAPNGTPVVAAWDESPSWTAEEVIDTADWVWKTEYTADPQNGESIEYFRTIHIPGTVVSAQAEVGADNRYKLFVNGDQISSESIFADYYNFTAQNVGVFDITSDLNTGDNDFKFYVRQNSSSTDSPTINPAGLIYRVTANYETFEECGTPINMPPVITVDPEAVTLPVGTDYDVMTGVTAVDDFDGDLTDQIISISDLVDNTIPGVYTVTYDVSDSEGLAAVQKTRTIILEEDPNTAPVITVNPEILTFAGTTTGSPASDGVSANDAEDGDITADIKLSTFRTVDEKQVFLGEYLATKGMTAFEINFIQQVIDNAQTSPTDERIDAISAGQIHNIILIGMGYSSIDTGAIAALLGSTASQPFLSPLIGFEDRYAFAYAYDVSDSDGLEAVTQYRIVTITENNPPEIVVDPDMITLTLGDPIPNLYNGVTASDIEDGDLTDDVVATGTLDNTLANTMQLIEYTVTDSDGNTAMDNRAYFFEYPNPTLFNATIQPSCDVSAWTAVITGLDADYLAPDRVSFYWNNVLEVVMLDSVINGTAVYTTNSNLTEDLTKATALLPADWTGTFTVTTGPSACEANRPPVITVNPAFQTISNPPANNTVADIMLSNVEALDYEDGVLTNQMVTTYPTTAQQRFDIFRMVATQDYSLTVGQLDAIEGLMNSFGFPNALVMTQPQINSLVSLLGSFGMPQADAETMILYTLNGTNALGTDTPMNGSAYGAFFDVADSESLAAETKGRIFYVGTLNTPPEITVDPASVTITQGDTYNVLTGVSATDIEDGDITNDIVVGGDAFDSNILGQYTITYDVTDSDGRSAVQNYRQISVIPPVTPKGSLTICKVLLDDEGNIITNPNNGQEFIQQLYQDKKLENSNGGGTFMTPLNLDTDILSLNGNDVDALCQPLVALPLGDYYYDREQLFQEGDTINKNLGYVFDSTEFLAPLYNDQANLGNFDLSKVYKYSPELFDIDSSNDNDRNRKSDGHIVLTETKPDRVLVIVNQQAKPDTGEIPVITVDPEVVDLFVGDSFDTTNGVTADDAEDGDITNDIAVGGDNVDNTTPGIYTVTYDVTDSDGNDAMQASRTYRVFKQPTTLSCEDITGNGFYGQYFNYRSSHPAMEGWHNSNYGDPKSDLETWIADWYDTKYYRFDRIDSDLLFGSSFFAFDGSDYEEELINGHEYHFGAYYQAKVTVPAAGNYAVSYASDDDMWVYLDGELVIDNKGVHAATSKNTTLALSNEHILEVFFAERQSTQSHLSLSFTSPTVTVEAINQECETPNEIPVITVDPVTVTLTIGANSPDITDGVSANDAEDGDITTDITTGGDSVNTNTPGTYVVTYDVTDSDGNDAVQKSRTYIVQSGGGPSDHPPIITVTPTTITLYVGDAVPALTDGVTASDVEDGDITNDIAVGGDTVDNTTPGIYTVTYDVTDSDGNNAPQKSRDYAVIEQEPGDFPPEITLIGDNPMIVYVTNTFTDPGATASDTEDGDITNDIVVGGDTVTTNQPAFFTITYNVMDSDGNAATEVTRSVEVRRVGGTCSGACGGVTPNTKPVITLDGDNPLQLIQGQNFTEPGYTANDQEDGNITNDVVISGDTVDTNTVGTYVITYNVTDSKGLAADQVTRTVVVGQVLGETPVYPACDLYFTEWLQMGDRGAEVSKLQAWLNEYLGLSITVDGIYGPETANAVGHFQTRDAYRPIVLTPWGYTAATKRFYKTTRMLANHLNGCDEGPKFLEDVGRTWETTDDYIGWIN